MQYASLNLMAVFLLGVTLPALSQDAKPAEAVPAAADIVRKYLAATGGEESRKSLQSLTVGGDFTYNSNASNHPQGSYTYSYKAPSSDVLVLQMTSHGVSWTGHRQNAPFRRVSSGAVTFVDDVDTAVLEYNFYSLLEWDFSREYNQMEVVGKTRVGGRWTYAVRFVINENAPPVTRYYDTETFLLLKMDQVQRIRGVAGYADGDYKIETYFNDYRDYGSLKLPQNIEINRPTRKLLFKMGKPKLNSQIADSVFQ